MLVHANARAKAQSNAIHYIIKFHFVEEDGEKKAKCKCKLIVNARHNAQKVFDKGAF